MKVGWTHRLGRRVPGTGPVDARIVILGEAPGRDEELEGAPFVGASGRFLWETLRELGVDRREVRVENVVEVRPPNNSLLAIPPAVMVKHQAGCIERLKKLSPNVIVPVGNLALNTLRGTPLPVTKTKGTWKKQQQEGINWPDKITNWRGSFFRGVTGTKVIPTFHPAFILRAHHSWPVWREDWVKRILPDSQFPQLRKDKVEVTIRPSHDQKADFLARCHEGAIVAVDIETVGTHIRCVGFAVDDWDATVVLGGDRDFIQAVLDSDAAKTFHFGVFDTYVLKKNGYRVRKWKWDSRDLHHLLDPSDRHTLAYCASRDLRVQFWKDEAKDEGKAYTKQFTSDLDRLMDYCGLDVGYTRALTGLYIDRVTTAGLLDTYVQHYRKVNTAIGELSMTGMRVDEGRWAALRLDCERKLVELRETLRGLAGTDLVATKGLSRPKVNAYFYGTLKCKPFVKRGTGRPTTDEVHVRKLMLKYQKAVPGAQAVLQFAHHSKKRGWFDTKLTPDGRYLSLYKQIPITGRLASSKTPDDYGSNGQNADRKLRDVFVAEPGWLIAKWDLSQAESRIVDGASGDRRGLELARTPPWELDQHRLMAAEVLDKPMEEVESEEREVVGKRGRHAYNYGMEEVRMAEVLLVETESRIIRTPEECKAILSGVGRARPYIDAWQAWVRAEMLQRGRLVNSWGRSLRFPWRKFRLTKEDYKQGYAWGPQGEVGCLLNQEGLLPARRVIRGEGLAARIIQQEHDALAVTGSVEALWRVHEVISATLQAPRTYPGVGGPWELVMPTGLKIGTTLAGTHEWKRLPDRKEFMAKAKEVLHES